MGLRVRWRTSCTWRIRFNSPCLQWIPSVLRWILYEQVAQSGKLFCCVVFFWCIALYCVFTIFFQFSQFFSFFEFDQKKRLKRRWFGAFFSLNDFEPLQMRRKELVLCFCNMNKISVCHLKKPTDRIQLLYNIEYNLLNVGCSFSVVM